MGKHGHSDDDAESGPENELSTSEQEGLTANQMKATQKRRKHRGALFSFLWFQANILLDDKRFPGDDTIKGYRGRMKEFLILLQIQLRLFIAKEDVFPMLNDFEMMILAMYEDKARAAVEIGCA